ncbi:MAG: nucleotidyltransferase domain-containing protein [Polyangiales bacterium]
MQARTHSDPLLAHVAREADKLARKTGVALKVLLFGSRARGDHHARSDYDIAIQSPSLPDAPWLTFYTSLMEDAPTLCGLDILRLEECGPELSRRIAEEARVIYDSEHDQ